MSQGIGRMSQLGLSGFFKETTYKSLPCPESFRRVIPTLASTISRIYPKHRFLGPPTDSTSAVGWGSGMCLYAQPTGRVDAAHCRDALWTPPLPSPLTNKYLTRRDTALVQNSPGWGQDCIPRKASLLFRARSLREPGSRCSETGKALLYTKGAPGAPIPA